MRLNLKAIIFLLLILAFAPVFPAHKIASLPKKVELTDDIFPRTDPIVVGKLYQMLKVIDLLFTKYDIPYWIDAGTALGAIRHKGCIPWDDDADLGFHIADRPRIFALKDEFAAYGLELIDCGILRLQPVEKYPYVDIAGHVLCTDNIYRYDLGIIRKRYYKTFYWLPEEIENLVRVPFGPIQLNAPRDLMRYVKKAYGHNCMTLATYQTPHGGAGSLKKIRKIVRIVDFNPAPYTIINPIISLEP